VTVGSHDGAVVLEVVDDGMGFDPHQVDSGEHFGLRGLRDLIDEAGGRLDVRSSPGAGTTVRLEVDRG
jgi:two-component system, NarL family, sensor kinase